jgi:hypothetical protein
MTIHRGTLLCGVLIALALLAGCGKKEKHDDQKHGGAHFHAHERGEFMIADAGKHHATLTAHRSTKGNELDLAFETQDEDRPTPVAVPLASIKAEASTPDGQRHELTFEPAPKDERPETEAAGTCSKFTAKAPWFKNTDKIDLVAKVQLDGKDVTIRFKNFDPMKYGHDADADK